MNYTLSDLPTNINRWKKYLVSGWFLTKDNGFNSIFFNNFDYLLSCYPFFSSYIITQSVNAHNLTSISILFSIIFMFSSKINNLLGSYSNFPFN